MTRLALFGGTFDPIHNAHLEIARVAAREWRLDRVLFIPAARPPHKSGSTRAPYEDRYHMVALACQDQPGFEPSRLEAGVARSYSIRTIGQVRGGLAPGDELFFLIGADAFAEIRTWMRWRDVLRQVEFIVMSRPGHVYDIPEGARVHRLDLVNLPVSSSEIRSQLAAGKEPAEVPAPVLRYIRQRHLYTDTCEPVQNTRP